MHLYPTQTDFISKAKSIITNHKLGIFSSPTGSGKTLSLLFSIQEALLKESFGSVNVENQMLMELLFGKEQKKCNIFYCSRTHSQLEQSIKEMKNVYPEINSVIIGSRKVYCLNEEVSKIGDLELVNEKCNELVECGKCVYYLNGERMDGNFVEKGKIKESIDRVNNGGCTKNGINKSYNKESIDGVNNDECTKKGINKSCNSNGCNKESIDSVNNEGCTKNPKDKSCDKVNIRSVNNEERCCNEKSYWNQECIKKSYNIDCKCQLQDVSNNRVDSMDLLRYGEYTKASLNGIHDIEDIKSYCKINTICPYYFTRKYMNTCDVIFMPYSLLFTKEGRSSLGIDLKDSIIIIDEAHNIYDTIIQLNSVSIAKETLIRYYEAFMAYKSKYEKRMLEKNLINIKDIIKVLDRLIRFIDYGHFTDDILSRTTYKSGYENSTLSFNSDEDIFSRRSFEVKKISTDKDIKNRSQEGYEEMKTICDNNGLHLPLHKSKNDLLDVKEPINKTQPDEKVCKIPEFLIKSHLLDFHFLELEEYLRTSKLTQRLEGFGTSLHFEMYNIMKFLKQLVISDEYGRIFYSKNRIRFTTLDPKNYIQDLAQCRSIILAGGTMEPINNLMNLFSNHDIEYHRYPSVCPNFRSYILSEGPSNREMVLNYNSKNDNLIIDEILKSIYNLSFTVKKGGIVCFMPSKNYIETFKSAIIKLNFKRKVIFDSDHTFSDYKKILKTENVIFFIRMGGTLSEGINFNDELCRLLIIIGVPFPTMSVELRERIKHNGPEYSKLIAMKTVNQALGRALRHKDDYSAIVLIDKRYKSLVKYISPWISENINMEPFTKTLVNINEFLKSMIIK